MRTRFWLGQFMVLYSLIFTCNHLQHKALCEDSPRSDSDQLQGTWICQSTLKNGASVQTWVGVKAVIESDTITWEYPQKDGTYRREKVKFRVDSSKDPARFDWWRESKPDAVEMRLYTVKGDSLRWSTNLDYKTRPETFDAGIWQFTMKREVAK